MIARTRTCRISDIVSDVSVGHTRQETSTHANDFLVHLLKVWVDFWTINGHATEWLVLVTGQNHRCIWESFCLGNEVDLRGKQMPRPVYNLNRLTTSIRNPSAPLLSHQCIMSNTAFLSSGFFQFRSATVSHENLDRGERRRLGEHTRLFLQEGVTVPLLGSFIKSPSWSTDLVSKALRNRALNTTHVPKQDLQLLGGIFSPLSLVLPSCQMYQSRFGLSFELRASLNHACCSGQPGHSQDSNSARMRHVLSPGHCCG